MKAPYLVPERRLLLRKLSLAYFAHSIRSDWNNGNAHFLRGLVRALGELGHDVRVYEPEDGWSIKNLRQEAEGKRSLEQFTRSYFDISIQTYDVSKISELAFWQVELHSVDVVVLHEWSPPALAHTLLQLRGDLGFRLLFHDTHHRASSTPEQILTSGIHRFDGVLAFGDSLRAIYCRDFGIERVWTLHEAADTTIFKPQPHLSDRADAVWIGNWGEGERSREIREFLLCPAKQLTAFKFEVYGVRYPREGMTELRNAGIFYRGYLPNLDAPATYSGARLTLHIPRQHYALALVGIPTIRMFEALACGIPLISAPWEDKEQLFRDDDYLKARNAVEMQDAMEFLLHDPEEAEAQAMRGLETVLARHTCRHRAEQLLGICEELLS